MKTAVEWLIEELEDNSINLDLAFELIEQAKEMEKQQIINANWEASEDTDRAEQYYNETFKSDKE